jgi:hypothetical protein
MYISASLERNALSSRDVLFVILPSLLLLGVRFGSWTLISMVTQFVEPLLHFGAWCLFVRSIFCVIQSLQKVWSTIYALWACSMYAIVIIIVWTLPISQIGFDLDIALKQPGREHAVAYLAPRYIPGPNISEKLVTLPVYYSHLSTEGEAIITKSGSRLMVRFYMWRGVLSSSSGFVIYTSDNTEPVAPLLRSSWRLRDNWFFGVER